MLPSFMSHFKVESSQEGKKNKQVNRRRKHVMMMGSIDSSSSTATMDAEVGLRLLPQITSSKTKSNNVLVKSAVLKKIKANNQTIPKDFCFLKTCNLCNKQLSPDKDIYMYRYISIAKPFYLNIVIWRRHSDGPTYLYA